MNIFKKKSKWVDLSIGSCNSQFYLLQGRRLSNGKMKFRVSSSASAYMCPSIKIEDLPKVATANQ